MSRQLRKSDVKELNEKLSRFKIELSKKDYIMTDDTDTHEIIQLNSLPAFFLYENNPIPTLRYILKNPGITISKVTIDMGAIKFIASGADLMRPGITEFENFEKNQPILIIDITHKKPLAIGIALFSSEELKTIDKGKVIKNIHYISDKLWKYT